MASVNPPCYLIRQSFPLDNIGALWGTTMIGRKPHAGAHSQPFRGEQGRVKAVAAMEQLQRLYPNHKFQIDYLQ